MKNGILLQDKKGVYLFDPFLRQDIARNVWLGNNAGDMRKLHNELSEIENEIAEYGQMKKKTYKDSFPYFSI